MAQNLIVNGTVYNGVTAIEMTNVSGEKVQYAEGGVVDIYDPATNPVEQGNIQSASGADFDSTTRLRVKGYIAVKPNTAYRISTNVAKIFVIQCAADKTPIKNSGWQGSSYLFGTDQSCRYIRITFQNSSGSTITAGEWEWMKIEQLEGGGASNAVIDALEITENGTYIAPDGVDGYSPVTVNVTGIEDELVTHTISATEYYNDRITSIGYGAFYGCKNVEKISVPKATSVDGYACYGCTSLTAFEAPALKSAGTYAFTKTKLPEIYFPELETMTTYSFSDITTTCKVRLPKLKTAANSGFRNSKGITSVDLAVAAKVDNLCFYYCNNLETLILRKDDSACTLANTNALSGTKIANGTGYIYVPSSLIDSYTEADTNWSTFANQFRALEDYTVDGTITGALDETKI